MEDLIIEHGLWIIALFLLGDDLGLPFFAPGTLIFTYVTMAKNHPEISISNIIPIAIFIPILGNYFLYFLGRKGFSSWLKKHGHKFFLPNHKIKKAQKKLEENGAITIFFASIVSSARPFSAFMAGTLKMPFYKFAIPHFLGLMVWVSIFVGGGYYFGGSLWTFSKEYWKEIILAVFLIVPSIFFWKSYFIKPKK